PHAMPPVAPARDRATAELPRRTDGISVAMVTTIAPDDARRCRLTLLEQLLPDASLVFLDSSQTDRGRRGRCLADCLADTDRITSFRRCFVFSGTFEVAIACAINA